MVVGLFFACAGTAPAQEVGKNGAGIIERAKKAASYGLKDPNSAQFRNVFVSYMQNYVCGEINAKNSYGAYTGFNLFLYDDNTGEAEIPSPENAYYEVALQRLKIVCRAGPRKISD